MAAKYTEYLRTLMMNEHTAPLLEKALSTYPLYEPEKHYDLVPNRSELNQRLLNHYKYREIGFETVGRFLDELEITMCEIMPRYNELLKTVVIMAELPSPFDNVDVVEKYEETRTSDSTDSGSVSSETSGTSTSTTSTNGNDVNENHNKKVHSETPQAHLDVTAKNIDKVDYADDVEWDKAEESHTRTENSETGSNDSQSHSGESTNTKTSRDTVTHTFTKTGNQGVNTYAHDMNEFRTSIIDVIDQIINDTRLNDLFMNVY